MTRITLAWHVVFCAIVVLGKQGVAATVRAPSGFYVLTATDGSNISSTDLKNSHIAGLSIRFSWSAAEPQPGVYNWSYVDSQIALAKQAGKTYMLRPMAGIRAPSWLYTQGAQWTTSDRTGNGGSGSKMPLPWDPIMLSEWDRFVAALGSRYGSDASLVLAHLNGPTSNSAEMHLPSSLLSQYPDAVGKTYAAWQNAIGAYGKAFPSTALSLNLTNVYTTKDGLLQSVASYAETALGARATLQNNSLSATTSLNFAPIQIMSDFVDAGGRAGFQMLYANLNSASAFTAAIQVGNKIGPDYYEIYKPQIAFLGGLSATSAHVAAIPEPATVSLAASAGLGVGFWLRRRTAKRKQGRRSC